MGTVVAGTVVDTRTGAVIMGVPMGQQPVGTATAEAVPVGTVSAINPSGSKI
jgi:hypothetical protein